MSIYDITYSTVAEQIAPPDKRGPFLLAWYKALLSPNQWLRDLWFGEYLSGSTAPAYSAGTYNKYDRVIYNKVVYESLINGNIDIPTSTNWFQVQANFIGMSERILYTGNTLTLTYALNKWFGTTFRQPNQKNITQVARTSNVATILATAHGYATNDIVSVQGVTTAGFNGVFKITVTNVNHFTYASVGSNLTNADTGIATKVSDIYMTGQSNAISIFRVGLTGAQSSKVGLITSTEYVALDYDFAGLKNFTIWVPVAVFNALASNDPDRTSIFRNFSDKFVIAGIVYTISTY